MRLYSVGQIVVANSNRKKKNAAWLSTGIIFWEIAKQDQTGYWVREHGRPRATIFVRAAQIGQTHFHQPIEAVRELRKLLSWKVRDLKGRLREIEKHLGGALCGEVYCKPWTPGSRKVESRPRALVPGRRKKCQK